MVEERDHAKLLYYLLDRQAQHTITMPERETLRVLLLQAQHRETPWQIISKLKENPPQEGPGIDIIGFTVGVGIDTILLAHDDGTPASEFAASAAGLALALAAAEAGEVVQLPACTIALPTGSADYAAGAEISNGAVTVNLETGNTISGLTIGNWYAVEGYNGGYSTYPPDPPDCYDIQLSNDNGSTWDARIGAHNPGEMALILGSWGSYAEALDANYGRLYFRATATSIKVRAYDSTNWGDNTGTISWRLLAATYTPSGVISIPSGVEVVGLGNNSVLDGDLSVSGIITNLRVTGDLSGSGTVRMVANPTTEVFSRQIVSKVSEGTPPFAVDSGSININLNADLLDGYHASDLIFENSESNSTSIVTLLDGRLILGGSSVGVLDALANIGMADVTNPVIPVGSSGASDEKIREIGNVLYEDDDPEWAYKMLYTGYSGTYPGNEKIHLARSKDGKTWTKYASNPVISDHLLEDPHISKHNGIYYLFAEDKQVGSSEYIRRYHSSDCVTWYDDGLITGITNVQSPTAWIEDDTWYMLYEQYPTEPQDIRLATSLDGLSWTPEATNPVLSAGDTTWVTGATVPGGIIKIDGIYYLTFAGYDGTAFRGGLAKSTDLLSWTDVIGAPIRDVDGGYPSGVKFIYDTRLWFMYEYTDNTLGIYRGYPIAPILTISSGEVTTGSDYAVIAAESSTSDDLDTINGGVYGQLLVIQADSGDTITVKHGTGNIYLNGAEDFVISGEESLLLFYAGTNWSDVGAGGSETPALDDLSDVDAATPSDGQALVWSDDDSAWVAETISIPTDLDDLTDVDTTGVGTGDILYKAAGGWVDYPLGIADTLRAEDGGYEIGGASDYIRVDGTSGNLQLYGKAIAYKDELQSLLVQGKNNPADNIVVDYAEGTVKYADDCDLSDYAIMNIQINHDWAMETDVYPHLHWFQASANVPNWLIQYRWQIQGGAKTTAWTAQPYTSHAFVYSSGTLNQITAFGSITPPEGAGLSDILQIRLLRDTNNDSTEFEDTDPLTGDASAVNFDIHIQIDSFGSDEEYIKSVTNKLLDADSEYISDSDGVLLEDDGG